MIKNCILIMYLQIECLNFYLFIYNLQVCNVILYMMYLLILKQEYFSYASFQ